MFSILDAEDRLSKATDDLKRVTEHIEQEKAINKEVQRRQVKRQTNVLDSNETLISHIQMQLPPTNRNSNGFCGKFIENRFNFFKILCFSLDFGHLRIKEIIRTLEANSRNRTTSY